MGAKKGAIQNPTGKGGFGDNPQNRSDGGLWDSRHSFKTTLQKFKCMTEEEFDKWKKETPKSERTMAETIAYNRMTESIGDNNVYLGVANRTEGTPKQAIETDNKTINANINIELQNEQDEAAERILKEFFDKKETG